MDRIFAGAIYLYAGLAVAHWTHVNWLLHQRPGCGNVYSDPFRLLVCYMGPLAVVGLAALTWSRFKRLRKPPLPFLGTALFFGTSAALAYEASWFGQYGIEIGRIWWLPRF